MVFPRDEGNAPSKNEAFMNFVTGGTMKSRSSFRRCTGTGSSMHDLAGDFFSRSDTNCLVTGVKLSSEVEQCTGGIETDKSRGNCLEFSRLSRSFGF